METQLKDELDEIIDEIEKSFLPSIVESLSSFGPETGEGTLGNVVMKNQDALFLLEPIKNYNDG